jgi:predicted nucleic acid-binding protein
MATSRRRTRTPTPPPQRLILDSGAVIALARKDQRARATLTAAWEAGVDVAIPSVVVAETVRGSPRDASVNRVIKSVGSVTAADGNTGRVAGALLGAARSTSTIDALVVASAIERGGGVVLTGDPDDLRPLADGHPEVVISSLQP